MEFVLILVVPAYLLIAFLWGSFLNGLTAPDGGTIKWGAVWRGLTWPLDVLGFRK